MTPLRSPIRQEHAVHRVRPEIGFVDPLRARGNPDCFFSREIIRKLLTLRGAKKRLEVWVSRVRIVVIPQP